MNVIEEREYVKRATAAWFRNGGKDQPAGTSGVRDYNDKAYVVLENVRGTLAVFRIKPDGRLRHLRRWPAEITAG